MSMPTNLSSPESRLMTVAEIVDATSIHPMGQVQITIPEFQRGLVWKPADHEGLIKSIEKGYPIGSLLLYKDESASESSASSKTYFKLIDGLQRTQALKSYMNKANSLFTENEFDLEYENLILTRLSSYARANRKTIRRTVVTWVKDRPGFKVKDWEVQDLIRTLLEDALGLVPGKALYNNAFGEILQNESFINQLKAFVTATREKRDISKNKIPVIIYKGASYNLKKIYELVNSKGKPLSPYDILAAQWLDCRLRINNSNIRDAIYIKYRNMQNAGYPLDISDQMKTTALRRKRDYNLYQYMFGLGQFLSEKYPYLFKRTDPEKLSRISFNLVPACFEINIAERANLQDVFEDKTDSEKNGSLVARIEKFILESASIVDDTLRDILSIGRKDKKGRPPIHHTEQQIISMIATAFRLRYSKDTLVEKDGWENKWKKLERNLPMFYLFDILSNTWGRGGDQTLFRRVVEETYMNSQPSKSDWERALSTWFSVQLKTKKAVRARVPLDSARVLLLKFLHYKSIDSKTCKESFDVEHIISVSKLVKEEEIYWQKDEEKHHKGPINTIGNLGFLNEHTNRKKGSKSFYEYVHSQHPTLGIGEDELLADMNSLEDQLFCPRILLPSVLTEERFEEFLQERWRHLKTAFLDAWTKQIPDD